MRKRMIPAVLAAIIALSAGAPSFAYSAETEKREAQSEEFRAENPEIDTAEPKMQDLAMSEEEINEDAGSESAASEEAGGKDDSAGDEITEPVLEEPKESPADSEETVQPGEEAAEQENPEPEMPEYEEDYGNLQTEEIMETLPDVEISDPASDGIWEEEELFRIWIPGDDTDHTAVIFLEDLEKLKNGSLKDENSQKTETRDGISVTEFSMPEMQNLDLGMEQGCSEEITYGRTIDCWTDQEAGLLTEETSEDEERQEPDQTSLTDLEIAKKVLPEDISPLLTEETLDVLREQPHEYPEGAEVKFYVIPSDGYEVEKVTVQGENSATVLEETASGIYEFPMPQSDVSIEIYAEKKDKNTEEKNMKSSQGISLMAAAPRSGIAVQKVNADTKMKQDYAFTYAFREGVTTLKSISRYNGTLNTRLHGWFGDENGFTSAYCSTFYGALINDSTYSSPISVLYSNVGEYQGQIVDLKVTAASWGTVNNEHVGLDGTPIYPCILFYKDRIAFNTISVGTVRFQFEFYRHNTEIKISPKGHVTMADLDGGQGFRIYDNWGVDGLYIRNGYDHLKASAGSSAGGSAYLELRGEDGVATTNSDPKGWCQVDFNGSFTVNWLAQKSWNTSRGPMNAFFISTSQSVGTYEPNPAPEKRVGASGASFEKMGQCSSETNAYGIVPGQTFEYVISQRLLPGNYSKFEVTDTLDSCLTYKSSKVQTAGGQDVTKYFTVSQSGNTIRFSAQPGFLKTDEAMNDVTYYFRIQAAAKDSKTIAAHNHYKESVYYIKNSAKRQIVSSILNDTQSTNVTYVKGAITGSCSVRKVDVEDSSRILSGAKFGLYQWSRGRNQYLFLKDMSYNAGSSVYESGSLSYTEENQGKFRIVETEAPKGYEGGWQKDFNVTDLGSNAVYEAPNAKVRIKYGQISLIKKDSFTGEEIKEKDGLFKIYQWNKETGSYEDTLETPEIKFHSGQEAYLSEKIPITEENQGKFFFAEIRNPTGYEGTFEKKISFDPSGQDVQKTEITALNTPVIPPAGEITVVKRIREEDITWAHGNPVFRFRIEGTDLKGIEHTYEDFVEFRKGNYTVENGYGMLTCVFENIPLGTYTVSELDTLRYRLEKISADTPNVSVYGETGRISLEMTNPEAALTFYNVKTSYGRYSHTDTVRNKISVIS